MGYTERLSLIASIEEQRKSHVFCYLTSLRPNVPSVMAEDQVRVFFDHLKLLPKGGVEQLDIFLASNGGSTTVPWRLVALFREFTRKLAVLIPYRAYSAATLLSLGADEIVMHPFAELGPIDPTVSNEFNPTDPGGGRVGISVEDVKAYVHFIRTTVGITHEDELVQAIKILAEKVHPLALGNVERFLSQSRLIAKRILRTHMANSDSHIIDEIVENMASKLYFHGHPINRKEARLDLHLKVVETVGAELEDTMWELYCDFEAEFENQSVFDPAGMLALKATPPAAPPTTPATTPAPGQQLLHATPSPTLECKLLHAMIESRTHSSRHTTLHRFTPLQLAPGQQAIKDEILNQGWSHLKAPMA